MEILLVDDEELSRESMAKFIEFQLNHKVTQSSNGEEALGLFKAHRFPIVLSDICMPGISGIDLLKKIREIQDHYTQIALFTGFPNVDTAIAALREGADDYIRKPIKARELAISISKLEQNVERLKKEASGKDIESTFKEAALDEVKPDKRYISSQIELDGIGKVGVFSDKMRKIIEMATKFHEHRSMSVLIEGETGTGKEEVIANFIHHGYGDTDRPFISINCSAISSSLFESELFGYEEGAFTGARKEGQTGKLELADNGSLFMDEIGDMSIEMQPKFLRVLENREIYRLGGKSKKKVDVRFIAATNQNLEQLVEKGRFRQDLFYRLRGAVIHIPPLREMREAIIPLAQMFLVKFATATGRRFRFINKDAASILEAYKWSGNVRELKNTIELIILLNDELELGPEHLNILGCKSPEQGGDHKILSSGSFALPPDQLDLKELETNIVRKALEKCGDNKSETARYLCLTRGELRSRLSKALE